MSGRGAAPGRRRRRHDRRSGGGHRPARRSRRRGPPPLPDARAAAGLGRAGRRRVGASTRVAALAALTRSPAAPRRIAGDRADRPVPDGRPHRSGRPAGGPGMLYRDNRAVVEARRDARRAGRRGDARPHGPRGARRSTSGRRCSGCGGTGRGVYAATRRVPAAARCRAAAADRGGSRQTRRTPTRRCSSTCGRGGGRTTCSPGSTSTRPSSPKRSRRGRRRGAAGGRRGRDRPPAGIPVVIGAADSQCVAFGAGVVDPGPVSEMAGASSCLNSAVDRAARRHPHHPLQPRRAGSVHDRARHQHERCRDRLGRAPAAATAATPPSRLTPIGCAGGCAARAPTRASWRRSSCRTSATASATTPTCAGRSSACRCATTGRHWPTPYWRGSPSPCTARSPTWRRPDRPSTSCGWRGRRPAARRSRRSRRTCSGGPCLRSRRTRPRSGRRSWPAAPPGMGDEAGRHRRGASPSARRYEPPPVRTG